MRLENININEGLSKIREFLYSDNCSTMTIDEKHKWYCGALTLAVELGLIEPCYAELSCLAFFVSLGFDC